MQPTGCAAGRWSTLDDADMARFELDLRLDVPESGGFADALTEDSKRMRARVYRELRVKVHSNAWARIDLGSERALDTLRKVREQCKSGRVVAGAGTVTELLDAHETAAAHWFLLVTRTADDSFSLWDEYPSYRPGSLPAAHALNHTFVSAAFVAAYQRLKLRGLSFLRCRNAGRKPGPGWFVALPDCSLGHGLDHPWFERNLWIRDVGDAPAKRASSIETGQNCFHRRWLRAELVQDHPLLKPVLELFANQAADESGLSGLRFVMVPRFWTQAFPDADFAYVPWGEDGPNREGKMMRFRQLMVSRKARQALIDARLFSAKAFLAVHSVALPENHLEVLDRRYDPVPPMYTAEELLALRSKERSLFAV